MKSQSFLSLFLIACMLVGILASCGGRTEQTSANESSKTKTEATTETASDATSAATSEATASTDTDTNAVTDNASSEETNGSETESEKSTDTETETDTKSESDIETVTESDSSEETTDEQPTVTLDGIYADSILYANEMKNGVHSYYPDGVARDRYYVENLDMCAEFALRSGSNQNLTYLNNKSGGTYIQNTMDVFIRMNDGKTYIGLCEDLDVFRALDANKGIETYTLALKDKTEVRSMSTDGLISSEGNGGGTVVTPTDDGVTVSKDASSFVSSDSNYKLSTVPYYGRIDTLNGYGPAFTTGVAYNNRGSNSTSGIATFKYNCKTTSDLRFVFAGWSLVYGGAQKYVWSVDGKTWHDVELYNKSSIENADSGMIKYANEGCGKTDFELYAANSNYQGNTSGPKTASGLAADLSDYVDQTVNVTFAVVPVTEPNALCILAHVTGIEVSGTPIEEETGGADDEVENPYNDPINYYLDANEMNDMLKDALPTGVGKLELDENSEFLRFYGDGSGAAESVFEAYKSTDKVNTGKYSVVEFRMPATNTETNHLQFFASTVNTSAK